MWKGGVRPLSTCRWRGVGTDADRSWDVCWGGLDEITGFAGLSSIPPWHFCNAINGGLYSKSPGRQGMVWMGGFFVVSWCWSSDGQMFLMCLGPISDGFGPFQLLPSSEVPGRGESGGWVEVGDASLLLQSRSCGRKSSPWSNDVP